jgi:hypothetical protein
MNVKPSTLAAILAFAGLPAAAPAQLPIPSPQQPPCIGGNCPTGQIPGAQSFSLPPIQFQAPGPYVERRSVPIQFNAEILTTYTPQTQIQLSPPVVGSYGQSFGGFAQSFGGFNTYGQSFGGFATVPSFDARLYSAPIYPRLQIRRRSTVTRTRDFSFAR